MDEFNWAKYFDERTIKENRQDVCVSQDVMIVIEPDVNTITKTPMAPTVDVPRKPRIMVEFQPEPASGPEPPLPKHPSPNALQSLLPADKALADLLLAHKLVDTKRILEAAVEQRITGESLSAALIRLGYLTEADLLKSQAAQLGISIWDSEKERPQPEAIAQVPAQWCRAHHMLPIRIGGKLLSVAMADPQNMGAIDTVRNLTGMRIQPLLAPESKLLLEIEKAYGVQGLQDSFTGLISQVQKELGAVSKRDKSTLTEADTRPVVGLVNHILTYAIRMGASDVHFEPRADRVDIRFRVDGEMQKVHEIPATLLPMLATRIKIMAELDIVEFRVPQDGRITASLDGRTIDLRVSVLPNYRGARIVLRILDRSISLKRLPEVGLDEIKLPMFRAMIQRPYGMVLVTGPTGSGKTTTLYSALKELVETRRNIMTCEDPVEYEIDGISQSQVNEKVGLTFAAQLRSTLRQDPDVILVGEIRDKETAETAIRAALTGHLVLSTLHCNDAPGAIPRLLDMGIDPYLLSTCLIGVSAQRLVRTLCPHCSELVADGEESRLLASALGTSSVPPIRKQVGCPRCFESGFRGREAVHEILPVSPEVASAIADQKPIPYIRDLAAAIGYEPLQVDAIRKVIAGRTTLAEAMRLIAFDNCFGH